MGFGSDVVASAEVSVTGGRLKIHRIVAATDPGYVVNPQQVEAQIAGSFVYGLSAMPYGECTVKDGRIEQENFDTYNTMRLDEMPVVEVITVSSGGFRGGVGESTIAVAAPAVLDAVFAATGKRVRDLPLKNVDRSPPRGTVAVRSRPGNGRGANRDGARVRIAMARSCARCRQARTGATTACDQTMKSITPPSTRRAAPVVAEASGEAT